MDWASLIRERWEVIRSHPWTFALVFAFGVVVGFGVIGFLYARELASAQATMDFLKERLAGGVTGLGMPPPAPVGSFGLPYPISVGRTAALALAVVTLTAGVSFLWPRRRPAKVEAARERAESHADSRANGLSYNEIATEVVHAPDDIAWEWTHNGKPTFIGLTRHGLGEPIVTGLDVRATNKTDHAIEKISGYIQSLVTNKRCEIRFNINGDRVRPEDTYGIPPRAAFSISSEDHTPGAIFLDQWAPFRFVFEYDGKVYSRDFTRQECKDVIDNFLISSTPPQTPRIRRREES